MKIIKKGNKGENYSIQTKQLKPEHIALLKNTLVQKVLNSIKHTSKYPKQIAKELKIHDNIAQ